MLWKHLRGLMQSGIRTSLRFFAALQEKLNATKREKEDLAQKLQEAKTAPDEIRREMEEKLSDVEKEVLKREKDLRTQRAEVERELKATYEIERNKMVKAHQKELTDMAAALAEKQAAMILKQAELGRDEVQRRVQELESKRSEVERELQQQRETDLASQKSAMTLAHMKELEEVKAHIAARELEVRAERQRLEEQLEITRMAQGKSEVEKNALETKLQSMRENLEQNAADLRAHEEEVRYDIEQEETKLRDQKLNERSSKKSIH